jgi:hypothetical protein
MSHTQGRLEVSSLDDRTLQIQDGQWQAVNSGVPTGDVIPRYQSIAAVIYRGPETTKANADRLALCWNSHDALIAAIEHAMEDHQCFVKCDGPHQDCICWYCHCGNVLKSVKEGVFNGQA